MYRFKIITWKLDWSLCCQLLEVNNVIFSLKDPDLLDNFLDEILAFQTDRSQEVINIYELKSTAADKATGGHSTGPSAQHDLLRWLWLNLLPERMPPSTWLDVKGGRGWHFDKE